MQMDGEKFKLFNAYCSFCEAIYGGSHSIRKNSLGYETLYIENGHDVFKICLADKIRFGKYDLFHRNWGERLGGGYNWHLQIKCYDLGYAILMAYVHELSKEAKLTDNTGLDYKRFLADFRKSLQ